MKRSEKVIAYQVDKFIFITFWKGKKLKRVIRQDAA